MLKTLFASLLSLFLIHTSAAEGLNTNPSNALNDEEEITYPYNQSEDDYGNVFRTYTTTDLSPKIYRTFKAPSGLSAKLSLDENTLEAIMVEMDKIDTDHTKAIMPSFSYIFNGKSVYVDSGYYTGGNREGNKQQFSEHVNGLTLFSADELTGTTIELQLEMKIEIATNSGNDYFFFIYSDIYTFEPYDESDYVQITTFYYEAEGGNDVRVDVRGEPMETLIYDEDDTVPNPDGFHVDDSGYEISILESGIPLGMDSVEMSFPDRPCEMSARLRFKTTDGTQYTFNSKTITVVNPHADIYIDGYPDRTEIQKDSEHLFSFDVDYFDLSEMSGGTLELNLDPYHLKLDGSIKVINDLEAARPGVEGKVYYLPSAEEISSGVINDNLEEMAPGQYFIWGFDDYEDKYDFLPYRIELGSNSYYGIDEDGNGDEYEGSTADLFQKRASIPYEGRWSIYYLARFSDDTNRFFLETIKDKFLDVVVTGPTQDKIVLNVPDEVNLVEGAGNIEIIPTVETTRTEPVTYYYGYELSKEGVVEVVEGENGALTVNPIHHGVVELTIYEECKYYSAISKTVVIRVIDTVFDVSNVEVPDEFHYSGKDLTASVSVRGFKNIQNLDVEWTVVGKDGNKIEDAKYRVNGDATLTLLKPETNDYTITALYEGIEIGSTKVEVRSINLNQFLRANIWWIVLITLGFVALLAFAKVLLGRGKTTVDAIERAYDVYSSCMSDDKLSLEELKRIRRAIGKCINRCEDMNIEGLNQYEKPIRYLRKSHKDTTAWIKKWNNITPEEKATLSERLDQDLGKALRVAKEIESAKALIEQYHSKANKKNYETLSDENDGINKKRNKE